MPRKEQYNTIEGMHVPESSDIECSLLSELVGSPELISQATRCITPEMFSNDEFRNVWSKLVEMDTRRETIDLVTISGKINNPTLMSIINPKYNTGPGTWRTVTEHCSALKNAAIRRRIFLSSWRMIQRASDNMADIDELMGMPGKLIDELESTSQYGAETEEITDVMNKWADYMQRLQNDRQNGQRTRVPTGFTFLDQLTYSGLDAGDLVVLAARPSVGKTAIMLQMAINASRAGFQTTIYSLEMTNRALAQRMVLSTEEFSSRALVGGDVEWDAIERAIGRFSHLPLYLNDKSRTLDSICTDIAGRHAAGKCGIAFIDYVGIMQGGNQRQTQNQIIAERTSRLKGLAKDCGIPIVLLCQLNRNTESENRPPQLHDLRDSGSIEQDADIVLMLERESKDLNDHRVNMWVRKNRQGRAGDIVVKLTANESNSWYYPRE